MGIIKYFGFVAAISLAGAATGAQSVFSLYKSTDQGASWFEAGCGLPLEARINALTIAEKRVIAGTDRGIFLSQDAGAVWTQAQKGAGSDFRVLCLASA